MDWIEPVVLLAGGTAFGWALGVARDRMSAVRAQQITAIAQLHERVLEVARKELYDGTNMTLAVRVKGGTKARHTPMDTEEVEYQTLLGQWREKLRKEEDRARLWIDAHTVDLVTAYFLLMMQCSGWDEFGQGNLTEDKSFMRHLRVVFGRRTNRVLKAVIKTKSSSAEAWLLDCVQLSDRCLSVIQRRIHREVAHPFRFRLERRWEAVTGRGRTLHGR